MRRMRALVVAVVATVGVVVLPSVPAWAAVTVSSFTPVSGAVGTPVTITGSGFTGSGTTCSATTVAFNGVHASCTYVSATTIKTAVPAGATTGPLTVNGVGAASPTFTVTLGISVTPAVARPGATVVVSGSAFDPYTALDVYFDTQDMQLVSADANGNFSGLPLTVPASAAPGAHWITAVERGSSGKSAQKSIRVATSWSQDGFSATHAGANPFENQLSPSTVGGLNEDWAAPTDGFLDRSVPAVAGTVGSHGVVYVGQGSGSDHLIAFDAQTGARLWQSSISEVFSSPAVSGNRVFVNEPNFGVLDAFSTTCPTSTCAPLWQSATADEPAATATVSGGYVYTADYQYGLDAFPTTCTSPCSPTWTGDANGRFTQVNILSGSAPAVSGSGRVFVDEYDRVANQYVLAAYSPASCSSGSCAPVWWANILNQTNSPIAVANGIVYASLGTALQAFRVGGCTTSPCAPLWGVATNGDFAPAVSNGVVYVMVLSSSTYRLTALDAATGATLWQSPDLHAANEESVPAVADGVVYVNTNNASNSSELWAFPTTGCTGTCNPIWHSVVSATGYSSSPVIVNGTVYDDSGDGSLYAYDLNAPAGTLPPRLSQLKPTLSSRPTRMR